MSQKIKESQILSCTYLKPSEEAFKLLDKFEYQFSSYNKYPLYEWVKHCSYWRIMSNNSIVMCIGFKPNAKQFKYIKLNKSKTKFKY